LHGSGIAGLPMRRRNTLAWVFRPPTSRRPERQRAKGTAFEGLTAICSSSADGYPDAWLTSRFWEPWSRVYWLFKIPESIVSGNEAGSFRRVVLDSDGSEPASLASGLPIATLRRLLDLAPAVPQPGTRSCLQFPERRVIRRLSTVRCGSFIGEKLYYPVDTLVTAEDNGGPMVTETIVVRSDGKLLTPSKTKNQYVESETNLVDELILDALQRTSPSASWGWASISGYLARGAVRPLGEILRDVATFFRKTFWLPRPNQFAILATAVPATFAHELFEALPLLLVQGPPGSGKTLIGRAVSSVACNSCILGISSSSAVARRIDEAAGFVVIDWPQADIISGRTPRLKPELLQLLLAGSVKATAAKICGDPGVDAPAVLNLYGIKMLCTLENDPCLENRALRILARPVPASDTAMLIGLGSRDPEQMQTLRDELHRWVFSNVDAIIATYRRLAATVGNAGHETALPLRVFAELAGDAVLRTELESALGEQPRLRSFCFTESSESLVFEASQALAMEGRSEISPTEVVGKIRALLRGRGTTLPSGHYCESPERVGRALRRQGIIDLSAVGIRRRVDGSNLRVYPLSAGFLSTAT